MTENSNQSRVKRTKYGGKWPKISTEIALRIADRIASGLPMQYACALETPPFPGRHFQTSLDKAGEGSAIALAYDKKVAEHMARFLAVQNNPETKLRGMPASVWVWERRFPQFFAPPKTGGGSVNVQINTVVGVTEDVRRRASYFVKRVETPARVAEQIDDTNQQIVEVSMPEDAPSLATAGNRTDNP